MLHMQATFWRVLMGLGMFFHKLAPPRPSKPSFYRRIKAHMAGTPGTIDLYFYVPNDYLAQKRLWQNSSVESLDAESESLTSQSSRPSMIRQVSHAIMHPIHHNKKKREPGRKWGGYPVVVNFHGGGFTLGSPKDDARWCHTVVDECQAVVVSVDYRLAPEHPFPTAVEDGADAVLWLHAHAKELGIDREKIALSGFSSGANMALTVPLRLYDEYNGFPRDTTASASASQLSLGPQVETVKSLEVDQIAPGATSTEELLDPASAPPPIPGHLRKADTTMTERALEDVSIKCIVSWYPSLDYTRTREQRRATCVRKDQELPALFTDLFDESYLHPPHSISLDSPYLSPGVAPTPLLKNALPHEIFLVTCEWDMLLDEGVAFHKRLVSPEIGKNVIYHMIEGVPHGWDKAPNPWKPTPGVREHYLTACHELRRVFGDVAPDGEQIEEHQTEAGPSAAAQDSEQLVR